MGAPKGRPRPPGSGKPKGYRTPAVRARIAAAAKVFTDHQLSAERVLEECRRLAFLDIRGFYDEHGQLKPVTAWTPEQGAAVAQLETLTRNVASGDGHTDTVYRLKLVDKLKALDTLAKHFGLLTEKIEHSGALVLRHELPD